MLSLGLCLSHLACRLPHPACYLLQIGTAPSHTQRIAAALAIERLSGRRAPLQCRPRCACVRVCVGSERDGVYRHLHRNANGNTWYRLYERGEMKDWAAVFAGGLCYYDGLGVACAPDDPRMLALIALVAPVEVRSVPQPPAPHSPAHSPPSNRPMDRPALFASAGAGGRRSY